MKTYPQCPMVEGMRPLVGTNGWDYCILWKLTPEQRFLEWMGCCCSGTDQAGAAATQSGEMYPAAPEMPCRDVLFKHPWTSSCEELAELPPSIPLDSCLGIHAQVLISNQISWQTSFPDSISHDMIGARTRVLIPVAGGLVELFSSKHIAEDPLIAEIIIAQCNAAASSEQAQSLPMESHNLDAYHHIGGAVNDFQQWIPQQSMPADHPNFPWELSEQQRLYPPHLNLYPGAPQSPEVFSDGTGAAVDSISNKHSVLTTDHHRSVMAGEAAGHETAAGRAAESGSEGSEQGEDDDDPRLVGTGGKRHQAKNLQAERKRRKKLNDRLYSLRALVPKITKMDRASILGDAIEYVMELQKQVNDLQDELESTGPEDDGGKQIGSRSNMDLPNPVMELDDSRNSSRVAAASSKMGETGKNAGGEEEEKGQQMEPQVEVKQLDANEFYLKVFCEHKKGGFARLMEAMSSQGLEVTNANVSTFRKLVMNVFRVEKRDSAVVHAEQVRDSLLELTRDPAAVWEEAGKAAGSGGGDYLQQQHQQNGSYNNGSRRHRHHQHHGGNRHHLHYMQHQA